MWIDDESRVPIPIHVDESKPESHLSPNLVETSVGLVVVFDDVSVSSIAERSVGWVLAVAEFVVSALIDVEGDWSAPGYSCIAGSVAAGAG